ncbi:MAG: hypothetical protein IT211_12570 [Armatimonadetes bacterium]|nr:hypothetical protein [Armatimonadota bacterium]
MNRFQSLTIVAGLLSMLIASCSDDPSTGPDAPEHEEPNKVLLQLTNLANASDVVTATFFDEDDAGGDAPTIDTVRLTSNATYSGTIRLYHQHGATIEELTADIERLKDEHQFFYTAEGGIAGRVFITPTDKDSKNLPVGLKFTAVVGNGVPTTGTLNVILGHFDEAPKDGVTLSPESDIDIDFPVVVK